MSWKEVLTDKSKFADDLKLNVNGLEVSLGELRQMNKDSEGALARKMAEAELREKAAASKEMEAADFYAKLLDQQTKATTTGVRDADGKDYNYDADPVLSPLNKRIAQIQEKIEKEYATKFQTLEQSLNIATARYLQDSWKRDFEAISDRGDLDLKTTLEHAMKNKLVDEFGVPNVRKAADDLLASKREEAKIAKIREEERERARHEALAGTLGRPSAGGTVNLGKSATANGGDAPKPSSLEQALEVAMANAKNDPDIVKGFAGLNPQDF
jgi:hypothetical protein